MTRRRSLLVGLACVAAVTAILAAVMWEAGRELELGTAPLSGRQIDQEPLEKAIERAASERPTEIVDIADFVKAEWDRLEVFGGYSTGAAVSHEIGHDWGEGHEADQIAYEGENALVFLRRDEVVAWIGHFSAASLACLGRPRGALRFYVREWPRSEGSPYRLLVPARPGGIDSPAARRCVARHGERSE